MAYFPEWSRDKSRYFSKEQKEGMVKGQFGRCMNCGRKITPKTSHGDHIIDHAYGGVTADVNGQMLCKKCHQEKTRNTNRQINPFRI